MNFLYSPMSVLPGMIHTENVKKAAIFAIIGGIKQDKGERRFDDQGGKEQVISREVTCSFCTSPLSQQIYDFVAG